MLQLLKYEFRKTRPAKLILAGIAVLLEGIFLVNLFQNDKDSLPLIIALLLLVAFMGVIVIGLQSILTLHRDMNSRQGYMLFMTPHTSYAILGAKVLECCLSILVASAFFFGLGLLDVTLIFERFGQLEELINLARNILQTMGQEIAMDTGTVAAFVFDLMADWMTTVLAAFLADVISSALLKGKKGNGFVSFLLFIGIILLESAVLQLIPQTLPRVTFLLTNGVVCLGMTVLMYWVIATVMDRKLSV